eukprot:scaffold7213_cov166-Amphora_coffeaeformis.AAC.1
MADAPPTTRLLLARKTSITNKKDRPNGKGDSLEKKKPFWFADTSATNDKEEEEFIDSKNSTATATAVTAAGGTVAAARTVVTTSGIAVTTTTTTGTTAGGTVAAARTAVATSGLAAATSTSTTTTTAAGGAAAARTAVTSGLTAAATAGSSSSSTSGTTAATVAAARTAATTTMTSTGLVAAGRGATTASATAAARMATTAGGTAAAVVSNGLETTTSGLAAVDAAAASGATAAASDMATTAVVAEAATAGTTSTLIEAATTSGAAAEMASASTASALGEAATTGGVADTTASLGVVASEVLESAGVGDALTSVAGEMGNVMVSVGDALVDGAVGMATDAAVTTASSLAVLGLIRTHLPDWLLSGGAVALISEALFAAFVVLAATKAGAHQQQEQRPSPEMDSKPVIVSEEKEQFGNSVPAAIPTAATNATAVVAEEKQMDNQLKNRSNTKNNDIGATIRLKDYSSDKEIPAHLLETSKTEAATGAGSTTTKAQFKSSAAYLDSLTRTTPSNISQDTTK